MEAGFLAKAGVYSTFSLAFASQILVHMKQDRTPQLLERLQSKGWIRCIRRGRFAILPLSSGENRSPQLHEFVVTMELASPAVGPSGKHGDAAMITTAEMHR
jgi:predicted transcriptional regulator of viral defense system